MNTEPKEPPPAAAIADSPVVDPAAAPAAHEESAVAPEAAPAAPATPAGLSPAECGARLATLFPALFVAPGAAGPFKPIKLRIHTDIQARAPGEFSKRVLGIFFSRYTTTNAYLKALAAPGAQRFDLDGAPAGEIAEEHRAAAVEELARRHAIAAERRAAQQPRRAPPPPRDAASADAQGGEQPPPSREGRSEARRPPRREEQHSPRPAARDRERPQPQRPPAHAQQRAPQRDDAPRAPSPQPAPAAMPADPAQRERVLLLRAFESSPLSKANFCALKRISEAELDALLAQAQAERRS